MAAGHMRRFALQQCLQCLQRSGVDEQAADSCMCDMSVFSDEVCRHA